MTTVALVVLAGLCAAEGLLRWQQARIQRSNSLEPGLVEFDDRLGWRLAPRWSGRHQHYDFDTRYSTNSLGFRADTPFDERGRRGPLTLVVGDSFTFGFGVKDSETFVHLLNSAASGGATYLNAGVPGYSTDQQTLLLQSRLLETAPDRVLLIVYVANDLFDNLLPVPLQVGGAKPYYELQGDQLTLRNQPVPAKVARAHVPDLMTMVLGDDRSAWPLKTRLEQRSELFRAFGEALLPDRNLEGEFPRRFAPALRVFDLLLHRTLEQCSRRKIGLSIALLAGRSFVERPRSVSGQFQDYFCRQISVLCHARNIPVIDIAGAMRSRYEQGAEPWFFRNDGHLTPTGHRVVASILGEHLSKLQ